MSDRTAPTPDDRCREALVVPVPDVDQHVNAAYMLQCEKAPGHSGAHRVRDYTLLWRTP